MKTLLAVLFLCVSLASGWPFYPFPEGVQEEVESRSARSSCGVSKARTFSDDGDRIVGGRDAKQGEFPWQVSLQKKGWLGSSHICGGAILDDFTIVTAAHCVDGGAASSYTIVAGAHNLRSTSQYQSSHAVSSITMHPDYNSRTIENDIAIMRLKTGMNMAVKNGFVNSACLPNDMDEPTGIVTVTGWGATREGGSAPAILQAVDVPVVSTDTCRNQYGAGAIFDSMLCAGETQGGKDSCQGDSGGPLIQRDADGQATLAGVVSWGYGCARPNYAGVYTKVSHFISWIKANRN